MSKPHHSTSRHHQKSSSSRDDKNNSEYYEDEPRSSSSSSSTDYKKLFKEIKHDYKRRKREGEELKDELRKQTTEAKKAKQDTQDLWKIYYTLQQELQQSYERSAKLQAEKASMESSLEELKKENESLKTGGDNPGKLKEALVAMQKEKLESQSKFNDIVIENKRLKEKESTYGPRIREIEQLKEKLIATQMSASELFTEAAKLRETMVNAKYTREEVERYQRWNSLLMMESQEKGQKIRHLEPMEAKVHSLWAETQQTRKKLAENAQSTPVRVQVVQQNSVGDRGQAKLSVVHERLKGILMHVRQVKMDMRWSGDSLKEDLTRIGTVVEETKQRLKEVQEQYEMPDKPSSCRYPQDHLEFNRSISSLFNCQNMNDFKYAIDQLKCIISSFEERWSPELTDDNSTEENVSNDFVLVYPDSELDKSADSNCGPTLEV